MPTLLRRVGDPGALAQVRAAGAAAPRRVRPGSPSTWLTGSGLLSVARGLARNAHLWPEVTHPTERRWALMLADEDLEAWVVGWPPGGAIELHDHGPSAGAVVVVDGALVEAVVVGGEGRAVLRREHERGPGESFAFGPGHVHDVVNAGTAPAVSVHVYGPRLSTMTFYRIAHGRLQADRTERIAPGMVDPDR